MPRPDDFLVGNYSDGGDGPSFHTTDLCFLLGFGMLAVFTGYFLWSYHKNVIKSPSTNNSSGEEYEKLLDVEVIAQNSNSDDAL